MQSDNTLILLANTYQDNLCSTNATTCQVLTFNLNLIRWNDGHTTPQDDSSAKQVGGYRWYATPCALTLKGSNSTRMSDEECRLFPYQRQEFVEIIGCGRTVTCGNAISRVNSRQQSELLVVNQFPLLAFLDALDRQAKLLLKLVVRVIVEIAHTGVYTNYGLQCVQRIFCRILLVINISLGNDIILLMTTYQVDMLLTIVVDRSLQAQLLIYSLIKSLTKIGHILNESNQFLQLQAQEDSRCDGTY